MNMKERMHAELPYRAWMDGLAEERLEAKKKIKKYNNLEPDDFEEIDYFASGEPGRNLVPTH